MDATDLSNMDMEKFGCLDQAIRIWAVGAIQGDLAALNGLHQKLISNFQAGDRLVYLGNYFGKKPNAIEMLDELLSSRRQLMAACEGVMPEDFIYLRGAREEMLTKLMQLQFAPNPSEVMAWLLDHHLGPVIES